MRHVDKLAIVRKLLDDEIIFDGDNAEKHEHWITENYAAYEAACDGIYTLEDGRKVYEINMSDVFAWGCADSEEVSLDELIEAYEYVQTRPDEWNGWIEWVSQRRQSVPQMPVLLDMQRRTPDERVKVPWYDKYSIQCKSKYYDLWQAVEKNAELETLREIVLRKEKHPFIND